MEEEAVKVDWSVWMRGRGSLKRDLAYGEKTVSGRAWRRESGVLRRGGRFWRAGRPCASWGGRLSPSSSQWSWWEFSNSQCPPTAPSRLSTVSPFFLSFFSFSFSLFPLSSLPVLHDISQLLNTHLDKETLATCIGMIETGVNPEALAVCPSLPPSASC